MLIAAAFLAGLCLAGYGVARWCGEREDLVLREIAQHYEWRQRLLSDRIDEGDQALLPAYDELDRLEHQQVAADRLLAEVRLELAAAPAGRLAAERTLKWRTAALATVEVQLDLSRRKRQQREEAPRTDPARPVRTVVPLHGC